MNEMVNKCYSCDFHRQDCTFTLSSSSTTTTTITTTAATATSATSASTASTSRPSTADVQSKKRKLDDIINSDADSPKR